MDKYHIFSDIHTNECKLYVWNKATKVDGYDESLYRKDSVGAWISWEAYGNTDSPFGWQIDHVCPVSKGGGNHAINLRAMHYSNNASKGEDFPKYRIARTSEDNRNIEVSEMRVVNETLKNELMSLYNI